jgi:amidohydrolase
MTDLKPIIERIVPRIRQLRRELHANPEPGYKEVTTASRVTAMIESLPGFALRRNVAVTGIVATLNASKPGPCVALRADMDCLPMQEETGLPYASTKPGLMHACGHDGHTAALVGAALVLSHIRDELRGPVKFLFQPAEEGGGGGRRMTEEGALENPHVDAIFGHHNMPGTDLVLGDVALRPGSFMGGTCDFIIEVRGRGGHAATPHNTVDPIYVGAQIVNALQSLVSRTQNPVDTLVITVGKFHAGSATNIIPETALLEGTIRSLSPASLKHVPERLAALARSIAAAHGALAEVRLLPGYPVTVNDARAATFVTDVARAVVGGERVKPDYPPILGAEDFAYYLEARAGCYYFVGTRPADKPSVPFPHHPKFDYNDDALPVAIEMHCELARRFAADWHHSSTTISTNPGERNR